MFADCIRVGVMEANSAGIKKRTVEGYLCNMAHIFANMGDEEPCMDILGRNNFCLSRHLRAYAWVKPSPDQVLQIPIDLLHKCWRHLHDGYTHQQAIAYLI